ncbi:MAG: pilus assembly protein N-terminal domain-containing protein [Bryobacteraceae bacterium]|nr:pilus assembly protein N-terminal domain-containing protein [Bryobacteraceae bacterium]
MKWIARVLLWLVLFTVPMLAQTARARDINVVAGKGELLTFEREVSRVVVSEPKIADALVVSPHEVMLNARSAGSTTLIIWETGSAPRRWDVNVRPDTSDWDKFRTELRSTIPESSIDANASGETIVLSGSVKTGDDVKRLGALASTRYKNVVNLLQTPAAGDPRQILLQVKFASIDRVGLSELGFNYFSTSDKGVGQLSTQQFQAPRFSQLQLQNGNLNNTNVNFADLLNLFIFRPELNFGATIRALQGRNLLQILAEPNLIAIEGSEASFLAGGQFPFPTLQATTTGGAIAPVVTVQFKPFGVKLDFKPTVTASGAIHLKVRPEVSSLDFANAVTLQGFLIPAIATRSAETEVVLRDGESFAIAGLIDNRVVKVVSSIRGLGDIPIVGNLFRSRSTRKSTDELLVVITPRFVRPLTPEQRAKLPNVPEAYLPTIAETKEAKDKKPRKAKFVGPRGHQEPR